ncbi:hypothetical protein DY000_02048550 [Brassica cretica]|uniref:Uncharacterized protein n=1 Tax=Brassica cretica TaxID=69181 RepID=A0ABQ7EQ84_BRACR|nr:hypothetical protein DY000_02048550 [Brassica cretica]
MTLNITPNSNPFIIHYNVLEKEFDSNQRSKLTNYSTGTDGMLDVGKRFIYAVDKLRERSVHAELRDGLMEEELWDFQSEFPFPPLLIIFFLIFDTQPNRCGFNHIKIPIPKPN